MSKTGTYMEEVGRAAWSTLLSLALLVEQIILVEKILLVEERSEKGTEDQVSS